jgi:hypothetical protein
MPGIIICLIFKEQLGLVLRATPSYKELACPTEVREDAANRLCIQIGATNFPRSTWDDLFTVY